MTVVDDFILGNSELHARLCIITEKLFELDPSLQVLFKGDMAEQGRKLMTMIGTAAA